MDMSNLNVPLQAVQAAGPASEGTLGQVVLVGGPTLKKATPERRSSSSSSSVRHAALLQEEETQRGLSQETRVSALPGKKNRLER